MTAEQPTPDPSALVRELRELACDYRDCDKTVANTTKGGFRWCREHTPIQLTTEHGTEYGNG